MSTAATLGTSRRTVLFATASVAAVIVVAVAAKPLIVLFGGVLFALVLRGVASALARVSRVPYGVCVAALVAVLLGLVALAVVELGPEVREQVSELGTKVPAAARDIVDRIRHAPLGRSLVPVHPPSGDTSPTATIASGAAVAASAALEVVGAVVVVFFVGVYGAARPSDYVNAVVAAAPSAHRDRVRCVLHEVSENLTRWLLGRLVAMIFVGTASSIAFTLLDVPLALTLGLIAGLLTFVEYVGAIASAVPAVLLAFTKSPTAAVEVLLVFTGLHVVEGYVLTPLLARASVRFPPALTLAGQVVLGALVGPLGLTFSTPLLVLGVVAVRTWRGAPSKT